MWVGFKIRSFFGDLVGINIEYLVGNLTLLNVEIIGGYVMSDIVGCIVGNILDYKVVKNDDK